MENSNLIGNIVEFSITQTTTKIGRVVDKILMKEKSNSSSVITGYIIEEEEEKKLYNNIAHWRINKIIN